MRLRRRFHLKLRLILALSLTTFCGAAAELRTWTSEDGRTVQAELVDVLNGEAVLKIPGRPGTSRVAVTRLSKEDQEYVKNWKKPGEEAKKREKGGKGGDEGAVDAEGYPIGGNSIVKRGKGGWPEVVALKERPSFTVVEEDKKAERFVYRSDHFEFVTTKRLSGEIVREFSRLFETTYEAVAALPLRVCPKPPENGYFRVILYASRDEYFAAGGIPGSGGMYHGRTKEVMVPLPNLGVKQIGERWVMEDREGNHLLIHEVTHQVMHDWLIFLPVWVTEGIAEYLTAGRYAPGRLTLRGYGKNMQEYKVGGGSRATKIRPLEKLMTMDDAAWAAAVEGGGAALNYRTAMLLFYYFCHEDGDGAGKAMIDYFQSRKGNPSGESEEADRKEYLLRGRDWTALTKDFKKGLASAGIRVDD